MQKSILKIAAAVMSIVVCIMVTAYAEGQTNTKTSFAEVSVASPVETITGYSEAESEMEIEPEEVYRSAVMSFDWDSEESYLLAKIAMAEAEGEDTEGKALVMMVVLNRVWSDEFPDSIEDVIYQKVGGNYQFSVLMDGGRWWNVEPDEDCYAALEMIENGWDESEGATYFEASYSTGTWHKNNLEFLFQHGGHLFYREVSE